MLKPSLRHSGARSWGKPSQTRKVREVRQRSRRFKVQRKKVIDGIALIQVPKNEIDEMDKEWMRWTLDSLKQEHRNQAVTGSE